MSNYSTLFGGASIPVGAIVQGQFASDTNYLPCDGSDQLKASYPLLYTSNLQTLGSNAVVSRAVPTAGQNAVVAAGNTLVMVTAGTSFAQVSTDGGNTWVQKSLASTAGSYVTLAYGNGAIVLTYASTTQLQVSTDGGNTWALKTPGSIGSAIHRVRFAGGLFFAFGDPSSLGTAYMLTSSDGLTWSGRTPPGGTGFIDVAYNANTGQWVFVAFHQSGSQPAYVWVSLDGGVTQYQVATGISGNWTGIACDGTRWAAATTSGVIWSTNLTNWVQSAVTLPAVTGSGASLTAGTVRYLNGLWWILPGTGWARITATPDFQKAINLTGTPSGGIGHADYLPSLGRFVFGRQDSVASIATVDADTTKFRTPFIQKLGDGDRYYIKAK